MSTILQEPFGARIRRWAEVVMSIRNDRDPGPPDVPPLLDDEDIDRIVRIALRVGGRSFHNGDGSSSFQKWLLTLCGGLALTGVVGGIIMFGKLSAIEANQISQQRQLDQLSATVATLGRP